MCVPGFPSRWGSEGLPLPSRYLGSGFIQPPKKNMQDSWAMLMEWHLHRLWNFLVGEKSRWKLVTLNFNFESCSYHTKPPLETSCLVIGMYDKFPPPPARCCLLLAEKNMFKIEPFFKKRKKNLRPPNKVLSPRRTCPNGEFLMNTDIWIWNEWLTAL